MPTNTKIMIVEDENDVRLIFSEVLRQAGYRVVEAAEGGEAWRLIHEEPIPKLIVTDLRMPHMTGFRLIANLRQHQKFSQIPILISSGESMLPDIAAAVGAAGWLYKPAGCSALLKAVSAVLLRDNEHSAT